MNIKQLYIGVIVYFQAWFIIKEVSRNSGYKTRYFRGTPVFIIAYIISTKN